MVGILAALGVGIHFLHGAQVRRSAEVLLDQANRAEQKGDMARAQDYLERYLTVERFKEIVGDASGLSVERHALPNLLSLNFIVHGLLGDGVAASTRSDPQAKSFGEYVRAKVVDIPRSLLAA